MASLRGLVGVLAVATVLLVSLAGVGAAEPVRGSAAADSLDPDPAAGTGLSESGPQMAASGAASGPADGTVGAASVSVADPRQSDVNESPPPALPEPTVDRSSSGLASHDDATIQETATYSLDAGGDGEVGLVRSFDVDSSVDEFQVGLWSTERVVEADGFEETDDGTWSWTGGTSTPSLTTRRELVRIAETDGGGWATVAVTDVSWTARGSQVPELSTHHRVDGAGTVGSHLAVLGEHEEHVRSVGDSELRVVVPDAVSPSASPTEAADALAALGRQRYPGFAGEDVLLAVVGSSATGYQGGYESGDLVVRADQSLDGESIWFHEYAHAQQRFNDADDLTWLREGHADYLGHLGPARQDRLGYDGFRSSLRDGLGHGDVVLADQSTWEGSTADYERGALVVHALDAAIHRHSGGERSFADVIQRLNRIDSGPIWDQDQVTHDDFVAAVRAVGGDAAADVADRYATTGEEPAVADRETVEAMLGPHSGGRVTAFADVDEDVRWLSLADGDDRLGTVRHDVPEDGGVAPDRSVPVHLVARDADAVTDGFELEVAVGDPDVLAVERARLGPAFEGSYPASADVAADGDRVELRAGSAGSLADPDAVVDGGLVLGTVEVRPVGAGTARLEPMNVSVGDDAARLSASRTASVEVERQPIPAVGGVTPRDVDGDGLFRDVDADDDVDQRDVVRFFRHHHRSSVTDNGVLFDFSDSGGVGHGDVVALFETVVLG